MFSVLVVTALPDDRRSTDTLGVILTELERRDDVRVRLWYLRTYPRHTPWPRSRDVDALRRWRLASLIESVGSRRIADALRGARLRWWFLVDRPDVVVLDDGLGERLLTPGLRRGRRRVVVASRLNAEPPEHAPWEQAPVADPDLWLRLPSEAEIDEAPADLLPTGPVREYPESLRYEAGSGGLTMRRRLGLPPEEPLVVGWGDDGWIDGPDLFIRGLWALEHRHGIRANGLWLGLGADPHEVDRLRVEAGRCGVGDRFFHDRDDRLDARFCADAAFLPYRDPGDPFQLVAAVLAGLGVVTFDRLGIVDPLVVEVPQLDVESAADALAGLLAADRGEVVVAARRRRRLDEVGGWVDEFLARSAGASPVVTTWRLALHALDRTGPPRLAAVFVRWIRSARPDVDVDVVAFRGGETRDEIAELCAVRVLLDDHEPWDHDAPDPRRVGEIDRSCRDLGGVDALLLVSVAAGQVLAHLPTPERGAAPVVSWVVEVGEDLHWIERLDLGAKVDVWLAGSEASCADLVGFLPPGTEVAVVPEFVGDPQPGEPQPGEPQPGDPRPGDLPLVVGAGIGTHRKAPDLFLEVAQALTRGGLRARFAWVGGETDPLIPLVAREAERLGLGLELVDNTPRLAMWLAAADLFVHPARHDAFPLVCLEAAAIGTPVVAFDGVGGVGEMFGDAFCGVPYPDVGGMARLAASLLDDRPAAVRLGRRQRERVLGRYVAAVAAPLVASRLEDAAGLRRRASA